jgi:transcriptional regulator with XRE-family HTH domain
MTSVDQIGAVVAANVSALRRAHGLSMDQLSKASGVSKGMIVQVEQARTHASIATLVRLANALGVSVAQLVAPATPPTVSISRVADATVLWRGAAGGTGRLISGVETPSVTELWEWRLQPQETHDGLAHLAGSKEMLLVESGRLTVSTESWSETIGARESLLFSADVPHRYSNTGSTEAIFIMVMLEPKSKVAVG